MAFEYIELDFDEPMMQRARAFIFYQEVSLNGVNAVLFDRQ